MSVFFKNLDLNALKKKRKSQLSGKRKEKQVTKIPVVSNVSSSVQPSFPVKLHQMLTEAERQGLDSILSWQVDGRSFRVHKPKQFVEEILLQYFRCSKIKSFQRQLNFYKFSRIVGGPLDGSYKHPLFIRGDSESAAKIRRHQDTLESTHSSTSVEGPAPSLVPKDETHPAITELLRKESLGNSEDFFKSIKSRRDSLQAFLEASFGGADLERRESFHEGKRFSFVGKHFFFLPVDFKDL